MFRVHVIWVHSPMNFLGIGMFQIWLLELYLSQHGIAKIYDEPGLRIPNMLDEAISGKFKSLYCEGEDIAQSDPDTQHVTHALESMECVIVQDLFLK